MDNDQERGSPEDLGQDPFVERLRPDPSRPPERVRILEGLLGDSDREGYKRLYFTRDLDHYAEFRAEDVVYGESIPPDQSPFLGQQSTRMGIRQDTTIEYTRLRTPRPVDEFDLDTRLTALRHREQRFAHGTTRLCCIDDPGTQCPPFTEETCHTQCQQHTCDHGVTEVGTCINTRCNTCRC